MNLFDELATVEVDDPDYYRFTFVCPNCRVNAFVGWSWFSCGGVSSVRCSCSYWKASRDYLSRQKMPTMAQQLKVK